MDNDSNIKKWLVKKYRSTRMQLEYSKMGILSKEEGNSHVLELLSTSEPFMVGRLGAVEMRCVSKWMRNSQYSFADRENAFYAAGVFPNSNNILDKFCQVYVDSMQKCDVLGVWEVTGEKKAITRYCNHPVLVPIESIEPYYFTNPWSQMLRGKKVLIIHPFKDTIKSQFEKRSNLFDNPLTIPEDMELKIIGAVQSNAGNNTGFESWFDALEYMKHQIEEVDFDVAIIGAGAYGLPLAAYCKSIGKQAIQMAGATQILFGIKGKRWDNIPEVAKLYNEYWVRPSKEETPPQIEKVEGGSYW